MENKMPLLWKIKCRVLWNIVYHLHMIKQEEFWAQTVIWATKKVLSEGATLNWKHIRDCTNMRNKYFQACKPYLEKFADQNMAKRIKELI